MGTVREEFEKWAYDRQYSMHKVGNEYKYMATQHAWLGWQASRTALCVDLPRAQYEEHEDYRNELCGELDRLGVNYK